jgi:hypothetical protein
MKTLKVGRIKCHGLFPEVVGERRGEHDVVWLDVEVDHTLVVDVVWQPGGETANH